MMKKITSIVILLTVSLSLLAVPARRGWVTRTLTDGSKIEVQQSGDEYYHYWETRDGKIVRRTDNGLFELTDEKVPSEEVMMARRAASPYMQRDARKVGNVNLAPRGLLILVNYADVSFQPENTQAAMDSMMNASGYSYNGATGSARDYFIAQSDSQYMPVFDVVGPVTLSHNRAYYGGNTSSKDGSDKNPAQMVVDACRAVDSQVDFRQYDNDNNGDIDFVYIIYAGVGEADSEVAEAVWPHNWYVYSGARITCNLDGKRLNNYACSGEIDGWTGMRNTIGTPSHEFGHVIGLPDYYDADGSTGGDNTDKTPNEWSIMDYGCYNNGGNTPPNYSIFDKAYLGWLTPATLTSGLQANVTLTTDYSDGYKFSSGTTDYYIENRQQQGWDSYLNGHGMLMWRVNYNANSWQSNQVNTSTIGCTIQTANGDTKVGLCWTRLSDGTPQYTHYADTDPFPGADNITSWTNVPNFEMTEISETNEVITFKLNGGVQIDPSAVENVQHSVVTVTKVLRDGQLIILRDNKQYNAQGAILQ